MSKHLPNIFVMILSLIKSGQWIQSNIIPDTGINISQLISFIYCNHQVNDWEYSVTAKTLPWRRHTDVIQQLKFGSSCGEHTVKNLRRKIILVKLLDQLTKKHPMASHKIQTPSCCHLVKKFSTNRHLFL